jgi:hypothetical protein
METKSCLDEQKIAIDLFLKPSQEIQTNPSSGGSYLSYIKSKYSQSDSLLPNVKAEKKCKNNDNDIDCNCDCKLCSLKSWLKDCEQSGTSLVVSDHTPSKMKADKDLEINEFDNDEINLPTAQLSGGGGFESPVMIKVDNFFESEDDDEISCDYIPSGHTGNKSNDSNITATKAVTDIDNIIINDDDGDDNDNNNVIDNTKLNINLESMISKKLPTIRSDADVFLQCYMKQLELLGGNNDNYSNEIENIQTINYDNIIVEDFDNENINNNINKNNEEENIILENYDNEIIKNVNKLNLRNDENISNNHDKITIVEEF